MDVVTVVPVLAATVVFGDVLMPAGCPAQIAVAPLHGIPSTIATHGK